MHLPASRHHQLDFDFVGDNNTQDLLVGPFSQPDEGNNINVKI